MRNLLHLCVTIQILLFCSILLANYTYADEIGYQGTHILTYTTMSRLAELFQEKTGVEIQIRGGGCTDGVAVVKNSKFTMGGLCCPLKDEEIEQYSLVKHPVGQDIKVAIVHKSNPVDNLSSDQIRYIHQGKFTNWKELGWTDKPVAVIYRKHCLDREEPVRVFLGLDDSLGNLAKKAIIVRTDKELIDYVKRFPTAIGITSKVFTESHDVKLLRMDGVRPMVRNVKKGSYHFAGTLFIITKGQPRDATKEFIDFVLSDEGQAIVDEHLAGVR